MSNVIIDFETRSEANIKDVGAYKYSIHPSTDILCVSMMDVLTEKIQSWHFLEDPSILNEIKEKIQEAPKIFAHNAYFEYLILNHVMVHRYGFKRTDFNTMRCSSAISSYNNAGAGLEAVVKFFGINDTKHGRGRRYMLTMSRFAKLPNNVTELEAIKEIVEYCEKDVVLTHGILKQCYSMPKRELEIYRITTAINKKGMFVNNIRLAMLSNFLLDWSEYVTEHIAKITDNRVTSIDQVKKLLAELKQEGVELDSVSKDKLIEIDLAKVKSEKAVFIIKSRLAKSSVYGKIKTMLNYVVHDRVHDYLKYHGASTGRWSGAGCQLQNLKKGLDEAGAVKLWSEIEKSDSRDFDVYERIPVLLRSVFSADGDKTLLKIDYKQVEARILAWLVGDKITLDLYRKGVDLYKKLASDIFEKPIDKILDKERFVAKCCVLGLGYGMGLERFYILVGDVDRTITEKAFKVWRKLNWRVIDFWQECSVLLNVCAINKNKHGELNKLKYRMNKQQVLEVELPNEKKLFYWGVGRNDEGTFYKSSRYGNKRIWGGVLVENVCQAISREILADALIALRKNNYVNNVVSLVHDEIVMEIENKEDTNKIIKIIRESVSNSFLGLPVDIDSSEVKCYV